jgi:hypothetical protein
MFRFTIRELVLVTVIVALGVSWSIDRGYIAKELEQRKAALDSAAVETMLLRSALQGETARAEALFRKAYSQQAAELDRLDGN